MNLIYQYTNMNIRFRIVIVYLITLELGVSDNFDCEKGRICYVSINTKY